MSTLTDWASRCKQIMKIWRKVSAADKVPYLVGLQFFVLMDGTVLCSLNNCFLHFTLTLMT